jgi:hypothetical protein
VYDHRAGLKFEESLKVTIQCDGDMTSSNFENRAGVTYLTYIPKGY